MKIIEIICLILVFDSIDSQKYTIDDLPTPGECGMPREVVGESQTFGQQPWLALLHYKYRDSNKTSYHSVGTIIDKSYILTGAECIRGRILSDAGADLISMTVGEHKLFTDIDCLNDVCAPPAINISVAYTIRHENYDNVSQINDIGLIRLENPIIFSDWVKPICLPISNKTQSIDLETAPIFIPGFSDRGNYQEYGTELKLQVTNGTHAKDKCTSVFNIETQEVQKFLCAKSGCFGDQGSPLLSTDLSDANKTYYFLAGMQSYIALPCGEDSPAVYTQIDYYIDWIVRNMQH